MASPRFRDTGRFVRRPVPTRTFRPANLADLMRCLDPASRVPIPIRVRGAGSAPTDCNTNSSGTILDMTGLDRIVHIDAHNQTVTAEAGVRLGTLISALAEEGLELFGNHDQMERTLGGCVASPCIGAGIGGRAAYLSSQVVSLKVVTAAGKLMKVTKQQQHLLNAFRQSFGVLGVLFEHFLEYAFFHARTYFLRHGLDGHHVGLSQTQGEAQPLEFVAEFTQQGEVAGGDAESVGE